MSQGRQTVYIGQLRVIPKSKSSRNFCNITQPVKIGNIIALNGKVAQCDSGTMGIRNPKIINLLLGGQDEIPQRTLRINSSQNGQKKNKAVKNSFVVRVFIKNNFLIYF